MAKISFTKAGAAAPMPATAAQAPVIPVDAVVTQQPAQQVAQAPAPTTPVAAAAVQPVAPAAAPAPAPAAPVAVETVVTPTPVPGVVVASVNTAAPAAAPAAPAATVAMTIHQPAAPAADTGTTVYEPKAPAFFDDESIDSADLVLPRLNIVQKVGELSTQFAPGSIVLGGQLVLIAPGTGTVVSPFMKICLMGFQPTVFTEKVEGGLRGNFCRTETDVVAKGGTLDYNEAKATQKPLYQRLATALVLIEQPAGIDGSMFPHEFNGKRYALALYSMKGTSYTNGAKHFKSARKIGHLRENGYRGGFWLFGSQLKKFDNNYAYIPVVKPAEATTVEFRDALKELLGF